MIRHEITNYTYEKYIDYEVNANDLWRTVWYRISASVTANFPVAPNGYILFLFLEIMFVFKYIFIITDIFGLEHIGILHGIIGNK